MLRLLILPQAILSRCFSIVRAPAKRYQKVLKWNDIRKLLIIPLTTRWHHVISLQRPLSKIPHPRDLESLIQFNKTVSSLPQYVRNPFLTILKPFARAAQIGHPPFDQIFPKDPISLSARWNFRSYQHLPIQPAVWFPLLKALTRVDWEIRIPLSSVSRFIAYNFEFFINLTPQSPNDLSKFEVLVKGKFK